MEEMEDVKLSETPRGLNSSIRSAQDTLDSGYLTLTPHSGACTSITSGYRSRVSSTSAKRYQRTRVDPLQSTRPQRLRSKLNHLLNASESDYLMSESSEKNDLLHESVRSDYSSDSTNSNFGSNDVNLRGRLRRNCKTTVPITPASTRLQLLSPPPSPAVPSSSFIASEPIEEDVEMKLVIVPQSTPQVITSPRRPRPPPRIIVSPARINTRSVTGSSQSHKLSKLSITDITSIAEIKPKRLDFSQRAISVALHRTRATPDFTGRETVDIMALLGDKSNHWRIVSKIFSYLSPQDLCSVSMVSKTWRTICKNDSRANIRRLTHVIVRQNAKENLKLMKKNKSEGDIQNSPKSRYARKGYLLQVQNLLQVQGNNQPPNSPPVSPSKVKFHSFVKASRTLAPWEHLLRCPKCSFPSHVDDEKNVGTCSRQGCSMEFCTSCSSRPHTGPCKTPLLATPTKRNKQRLVIGSRQSKRNLRRL
ncbi:uncharacterized protein LOC108622494 [Ceratina calcarata]|uniref:Uncharacterized protein LOC108622494 n=1 Tax=Ceratina calcarata TaxID=156304 RepID=A0AAJ7RX39_9HYME|nr:uncharacterized protein LOC108622494 [Ceratina calcarata]